MKVLVALDSFKGSINSKEANEAVKKAFDALDWNYRVDHIYTRFNRSKHSYGQKYESYTFVNGDIGFVCPVTELVGIELY